MQLQYLDELSVGAAVFIDCLYLEVLINIPLTVTWISEYAFYHHKSLRILCIPDRAVCSFGFEIIKGCDGLLVDEIENETFDQQDQESIQSSQRPLLKPSVTTKSVQQYIHHHHDEHEIRTTRDNPQLIPLHLLAVNPSATTNMITTYQQLPPDITLIKDNIGGTLAHAFLSPMFH